MILVKTFTFNFDKTKDNADWIEVNTLYDTLQLGVINLEIMFHHEISKQVLLILQVSVICSVGVLNPDLKKQWLQMLGVLLKIENISCKMKFKMETEYHRRFRTQKLNAPQG